MIKRPDASLDRSGTRCSAKENGMEKIVSTVEPRQCNARVDQGRIMSEQQHHHGSHRGNAGPQVELGGPAIGLASRKAPRKVPAVLKTKYTLAT